MELRRALDSFYYSTALCDLRLMNRQFIDENITYNRLTASKIAEMLCVSKPAVTLKINELIRQGLVVKTPDPKDRRQNLLSINEEAVPNYKIYKKQDSLAVKKIAEMFSEEDIEKFCQMLNVLSDVNFSVLG